MSEEPSKVLLIGYGNPGRLDDGLGPALAGEVEKLRIPGVTVDADYQLTVEDAAVVAEHTVVIFADAALDGDGPFYFRELKAEPELSFSTHSVQPSAVLGMAHKLFGAKTVGYLLGIRGYDFNEFGQALSEQARANLVATVQFIGPLLREAVEDVSSLRSRLSPPVNGVLSCKTEKM